MIRSKFSLVRGLAMLTAGALLVSCSGGGGGGGNLQVLSFNLDNINGVFLNERLVFTFTTRVDPATVTNDTIEIRFDGSSVDRDGDGVPDSPGNVNATPPGTFTVDGNRVIFDPRPPSRVSNADTGFIPNINYSVRIKAHPNPTVKSVSGRPNTTSFTSVFRTLSDAAFPPDISLTSFRDFFPGSPTVSALTSPTPVAGDPLTAVNAGPDSVIGVRFSEPLLPSTIPGGVFLRAFGTSSGREVEVAAIISIVQQPAATVVRFEPTIDLPGGSVIEVVVTGALRDFGGNRLTPPTRPITVTVVDQPLVESNQFLVGITPVTPQDFTFQTNNLEDPNQTGAVWNGRVDSQTTVGSIMGQIVAGAGGTGSDGSLVLQGDFILDTDSMRPDGNPRNGVFEFTRLNVPVGTTLQGVGSLPLKIFVAGRVDIAGTVNVSGLNGENASVGGLGAIGRCGGGAGGDGGLGPFANGGDGVGPGAGTGGTGGAGDMASEASGGGGGGYGTAGSNGGTNGPPRGMGGSTYGNNAIFPCLAGSGGGGAGFMFNGPGTSLTPQPGSGGGAGGGFLGIQCGGILSVSGGVINADGGEGGRGNSQFSASAGGGSGGAVLFQSARSIIVLEAGNPPVPASITATGGVGGRIDVDPSRRGGRGGVGRTRVEFGPGSEFRRGMMSIIDPNPAPVAGAAFVFNSATSVAVSRFLDTQQLFPDYVFNPATDADPPSGGGVQYLFQGAPEDPTNPGRPDLGNTFPPSGFTANIDDVDDLRFIRFAIQFLAPADNDPPNSTITEFTDPDLPRANSISLRYFHR